MEDLIDRKQLVEKLKRYYEHIRENKVIKAGIREAAVYMDILNIIVEMPHDHRNNKVHLCDSCALHLPDCKTVPDDICFGDAVGTDNICTCKNYKAAVLKNDGDAVSRKAVKEIIAASIADLEYDEENKELQAEIDALPVMV